MPEKDLFQQLVFGHWQVWGALAFFLTACLAPRMGNFCQKHKNPAPAICLDRA